MSNLTQFIIINVISETKKLIQFFLKKRLFDTNQKDVRYAFKRDFLKIV